MKTYIYYIEMTKSYTQCKESISEEETAREYIKGCEMNNKDEKDPMCDEPIKTTHAEIKESDFK